MTRLSSTLVRFVIALALAAFATAGATAQTPTVTTGAASNVADLSAVVAGTVNGHGAYVFAYVQVGTTTSYGALYSAQPHYFFSNSDTPLTATLGGLLPNTTYHYRFMCENAADVQIAGFGLDGSFTTGPPNTPPGIGSVNAQPKTTSALISASQVTGGSSTATVSFEYGLTNSYGSTAAPSPNATVPMNGLNSFSAAVSNLTPSTLYHYRCKAVNAQGTTYSADTTFTTLDVPVITTGAPSGITDLAAMLSGSVQANGGIYDVSAEYGTTTGYGSSKYLGVVSGSTPQTRADQVTNLLPATTYHWRLAVTDGVATYYGNDVLFTTGVAATPPVVVSPVWVSVSSGSPTTADVNPFSVQSGSSPAFVSVEFGPTTAYGAQTANGTPVAANTLVTNGPAVHLTGLTPSTIYHCRYKVTNGQGAVYSDDATFTTPAGPALDTSPATNVTDLGATLNGAVNTDGLLLAVSFEYGASVAYGRTVSVSAAMQNTSTANVSAQPPDLMPDTLYHYRIKGVIVTGPNSGAVFVGDDRTFTTAPANTPPSVPNVAVTNVTSFFADVTSQVVSGSSPTTVVYQYGTTSAYGSTVAYDTTLPTHDSSYTSVRLSNLTPATTYHVRAVATNAQGTGFGPDATFTTTAEPVLTTGAAANIGDLSATLNGSVNPNGFWVNVAFEIGTTTDYGRIVTATPDAAMGSSVVPASALATGLLPSTTYHYRARASYIFDPSSVFYGPDVIFTTGVAATPPSIGTVSLIQVRTTAAHVQAATVSAGSSPATVEWQYGLTTAYGSVVAGAPETMGGSTSEAVSGLLTGLLPQTTYHYRIRVTNAQGTATSADDTFTTFNGPALSTTAVPNVTDLSALLTGTASTTAGNVTPYFEIGTTTSYGVTVTLPPVIVVGSTDTPVAAFANGLLPGTTYHYRLSARDVDLNEFHGADMTFTTLSANTPPTGQTAVPTSLAATGATLKANVQSGSSPATIVFQYGTTTAYGSQITHSTSLATSQSDVISDPLSGLTPATTYHYRVVVTNNEGTSNGADITFTTPAPPTVTTGTATNILPTTATLGGSHNKQGGIYSVVFDYGETTAYGFTASPQGGIIILGGGGLGGGIIIGGGNTT